MNSKYYGMLKFLRKSSVMRRRFTLPVKFFKSKFWKSESYFPEMPSHKSRFRIFCELMGHIVKYGSIEWYYFAYGFDIKGFRDKRDYVDESYYFWKSSMINTVFPDWDYTCILRDKNLFSEILTMWHYATPHVVFNVQNRQDADHATEEMLSKGGGYFCKPYDGQCGGGIFKVVVRDGQCQIDGNKMEIQNAKSVIYEKLSSAHYLVQTLVEQHPMLDKIYDKSINTLRLTTVYDKKNDTIVPFTAFFRTGVNGAVMDNWATGGLLITVDLETGELSDIGWYKHGVGTTTTNHPNSKIPFKGVKLPYYEEAVRQAKELHYHLKNIAIIGWDIAFTPDGPLFIEGNDNIEIGPIQTIFEKGYKKELEKYFSF